jgi:hypothetical protein
MTGAISALRYPGDENTRNVDRTVLALARAMRTQREQGDAMVALIAQASPGDGTGRLISVRV